MRSFHTGGIAGAQGDITQGLPRVEELFEARVPKDKAEISEIDGVVEIVKDENSPVRIVRVVSTNVFFDEYQLPEGSQVLVNDRDKVHKDQVIALMPAENGSEPIPVLARTEGEGLIDEKSLLSLRLEECEERAYSIPAARNIVLTPGHKILPAKANTPAH